MKMNESIDSWENKQLDIPVHILRGIYNYGFEKPSNIQINAILSLKQQRDVIAQSQSGIGKTAAFVISALLQMDENQQNTQTLILSPTRELCIQTHKVCNALSRYTNIHSYMLIGGTSLSDNMEHLKKRTPHIIIGCVGRIHDMIHRNLLDLQHCKIGRAHV